ncbi:MAG: hypothetical protein PHU25_13960 [Deltaproteobacteria bacterium]|nr:hypothetical protein [Deltaproteobacteria bacterium]
MSWACYSCGTVNPNSVSECKKCGGVTAAPSKFYPAWALGGAVLFLLAYIAAMVVGGVVLGGILKLPAGTAHVLSLVLLAILVLAAGVVLARLSWGKTIIEAGIASVIGQLAGFAIVNFTGLAAGLGVIEFAVCAVVGIGLAVLGAFLGEWLQDRPSTGS